MISTNSIRFIRRLSSSFLSSKNQEAGNEITLVQVWRGAQHVHKKA